MSKTILLISPIPTHPQLTGNCARVLMLFRSLRDLEYDVHFVHIQETPGDDEQMRQAWGVDHFHCIPYQRPKTNFKNLPRLTRKVFKRIRSIFDQNTRYICSVDDAYDNQINHTLTALAQKLQPDIVIGEYIFFSKALDCFGSNVLKIIDTHDIFADRHKVYLKNGETPRWYSTTEREEIKGLNRADAIIAIQEKEAEFFSKRLPSKSVVTVGHLVSLQPPIQRQQDRTILFLGSSNHININGIQYFLQKIFPLVRAKMPDATLILAGEISKALEDCDGCIKLGIVDTPEEAYSSAAMVINPVLFGTGLKIKTIEALAHSKPLVTTTAGAIGLEPGIGNAFLVKDSPTEFADAIVQILADPVLYDKLAHSGYQFAKQWNYQCLSSLENLLKSHLKHQKLT